MNETIKLRIILGIPLTFFSLFILYSVYLLVTLNNDINFLNYLSITILIVSIFLKLNLHQIYWYGTRIVLPLIFFYIIYFYLNLYYFQN